jgi:hypothetical protein
LLIVLPEKDPDYEKHQLLLAYRGLDALRNQYQLVVRAASEVYDETDFIV